KGGGGRLEGRPATVTMLQRKTRLPVEEAIGQKEEAMATVDRTTLARARALSLVCMLCLAWCLEGFALAERNLTAPLLTAREVHNYFILRLSWSPDGSQIAFALRDFDDLGGQTAENIWIVDRGGRTVSNLTNFPSRIVSRVPPVFRDVFTGFSPAW